MTEPVTDKQPEVNFSHPYVRILHDDGIAPGPAVTRITYAYEVEGTTVRYGVAHVAPNDNFDRKIGRNIARARLKGIPRVFEIDPEDKVHDMIRAHIATHLPTRWITVESWDEVAKREMK